MLRKCIAATGVVACVIALGVIPAQADKPVVSGLHATFVDPDPCTGLLHEITVEGILLSHNGHPLNRNDLLRIDSGSTDSGYVLQVGHSQGVATINGFATHTHEVWVDPATGARFQRTGVFVLNGNTGDVKVDSFGQRCIGSPTILP